MIQMRRSWSAALAGTAAFAAMMTSVAALADTTATVDTPDAPSASAANIETPAYKKIIDRVNVIYFGEYLGSSLGKFTDPVQPDEYGLTKENSDNSPQEFDHVVITNYKLNDDGLVAGVGLTGSNYMYGKGFELTDPYIKIGKSKLIKSGNLSVNSELRSYLPVSNASHNSDRLTRFRNFSTINYDFTGTKFSLVTYSDISYYLFGNKGADNAKDVAIAFNPNINYQLIPSLGFWAGYEMDAKHTKDKYVNDWKNAGTFLYLGTSWDATSKLNITPFLQFRPGGAINADSTELLAYVSYKLL